MISSTQIAIELSIFMFLLVVLGWELNNIWRECKKIKAENQQIK